MLCGIGCKPRLLCPGHGHIARGKLRAQLQHFFFQGLVARVQPLQAGGTALLGCAVGLSQGAKFGHGAVKAALGCVIQGSGSSGDG